MLDEATAEPRDGYLDTRLHLACSTGSLIVPLSTDFTTANITDNKMYESITSSLPLGMVRYVVGDEGYDDHKLCDFSRYRGHPVFSLERYRHTTDNNRLALLQFYQLWIWAACIFSEEHKC